MARTQKSDKGLFTKLVSYEIDRGIFYVFRLKFY